MRSKCRIVFWLATPVSGSPLVLRSATGTKVFGRYEVSLKPALGMFDHGLHSSWLRKEVRCAGDDFHRFRRL
jgi:hypothetical protein